MLLIGSRALSYHLNGNFGSGKDWDFICTREWFKNIISGTLNSGQRILKLMYVDGTNHAYVIFKNGTIIEASFMDDIGGVAESDAAVFEYERKTNKQLVEVFHDSLTSYVHHPLIRVASPDTLYMLKMSHRFKKDTPHFAKTMDDIRLMRNQFGFFVDEIHPDLEAIYKHRQEVTYTQKKYKLNVSKENFFVDNVPYKYDHDSIHRAVALDVVPAYTRYMKDGADVMCDREKFFNLPFGVQLNGVLEESYVLALERAVIPHNTDPERAFKIALEKVCTSITSGWFREFAWENYHAVIGKHQEVNDSGFTYVDRFNVALENGKILPYANKY